MIHTVLLVILKNIYILSKITHCPPIVTLALLLFVPCLAQLIQFSLEMPPDKEAISNQQIFLNATASPLCDGAKLLLTLRNFFRFVCASLKINDFIYFLNFLSIFNHFMSMFRDFFGYFSAQSFKKYNCNSTKLSTSRMSANQCRRIGSNDHCTAEFEQTFRFALLWSILSSSLLFIENSGWTYLSNVFSQIIYCTFLNALKDEEAKTRPPETLKCS